MSASQPKPHILLQKGAKAQSFKHYVSISTIYRTLDYVPNKYPRVRQNHLEGIGIRAVNVGPGPK